MLSDDMLYARLRDPWERQPDLRHLLPYAREWSTSSDSRVPHRIRLGEARA